MTKHNRQPLPKRFDELNTMRPLRPIHDGAGYDRAVKVLDRLLMLGRPTKDQRDYMETLTVLIAAYDDAHFPIADVSPVEALKSLCEDHSLSASDLGELLGNRSLGSKILRGERELSKTHIRILCERFCVRADLFIRHEAASREAA